MFSNTKRVVTFVKTLAILQFSRVALFMLNIIEINDGYICIWWFGSWICVWPDGYIIIFEWAVASGVAYLINKSTNDIPKKSKDE